MNEQERLELEQLKARQRRLEQELSLLGKQLARLEDRIAAEKPQVGGPGSESAGQGVEERLKLAPPKPRPIEMPPPPIPPVIPPATAVAQSTVPPATVTPATVPTGEPQRPRLRVELGGSALLKGACDTCGGHLEFPADAVGSTIFCPHCQQSTLLSTVRAAVPVPPPLPGTVHASQAGAAAAPPMSGRAERAGAASGQPGAGGSFEMRLGTYWLVRVGIVMLLTGLVFFGNYAYQNFIGKLGPGGKVSLLYLASGILLGAGAWWQRKAAKESLRNYAQVLFAGGLAAVYFTTYSAYHVAQLKVIDSPLLDGGLLLAWAGFMVWMADRKKSEVLAFFAIGLAYYTSIITRVGSFTLYSNLVLTLAAVFFLVRNRWAALSLGSLVATYSAYGFWRFFDGSAWHWAGPDQGLWMGACFLLSYWVVFSAAVFLSKDERFAGQNRAGFLTLNNGAFFTMFLLTMLQVRTGGFWKFSLIYGAVLLALAEAARRVLAAEPLAKNAYLTQGLVLVTIGIVTNPHLAGLRLALVLAAESVVLLTLGQQRKSLVVLVGAYATAALAVGWGLCGMRAHDLAGLWQGAALGAFMLFDAFWAHRETAAANQTGLRPQPSYFTVLALLAWLVATWDYAARVDFPLALEAEGLALTASIYLLRVREIPLLSQGYVVLAQAAWLADVVDSSPLPPWWKPALMIAMSLGLGHWWQKQKALDAPRQLNLFWQGLYALAIMGVLYFWLGPSFSAPVWLTVTSLLAVALTAYGVLTRAWLLAACAQLFLLVSGGQFAWQIWPEARPAWYFPLAPIAALVLLSYSTVKWFERKPDATGRFSAPLLQVALLYRWAALVMSLWWVCEYIPARERTWVLVLLGLRAFLWAGWRRSAEGLLFSAAFTLTGLVLFWAPLNGVQTVYWPNLIVILILLGEQRLAKGLPERYALDALLHGVMICVGGLSLWLLLSRWVLEYASGFYLTASWSALALALFTCGIVLRERVYRWLGLAVLACALGRVVIFDVWKLETLYRILSFMALGIVLLVLGFIYNKYQEKIKEWL